MSVLPLVESSRISFLPPSLPAPLHHLNLKPLECISLFSLDLCLVLTMEGLMEEGHKPLSLGFVFNFCFQGDFKLTWHSA